MYKAEWDQSESQQTVLVVPGRESREGESR
jgi:hypothetical protein